MKLVLTVEDLQKDLPVGGDVDVFLVDMVVQEHCSWVLPRLLPESEPGHTHRHTHTKTHKQMYTVH